VPAVTDDHATLASGRPLRLTRTGLPPAGSRQLAWRTSNLDCHAEEMMHRTEVAGIAIAVRNDQLVYLKGLSHAPG
jgi:hypothetical protein